MDVAVVGSQGRNHRPQVRTNALSGHDVCHVGPGESRAKNHARAVRERRHGAKELIQ